MRRSLFALACVMSFAAAGAAQPAGFSPGDFAEFQVTLKLDERAGDKTHALKGAAEARVWCLDRDAAGTHFFLLWKSDNSADNGLRTSPAYLVLDSDGRLWPDLEGGKKISLDPSSWTAAGLIPRVPVDRIGAAGGWTEDVEVHVYGDLHKLSLAHRLDPMSDSWLLDRRPAAGEVKLKIGRKSPPTLKEFSDRWALDERGLVREWLHKTALTVPVPGSAAVETTIVMTARRLNVGKLSDAELKELRADAGRLKPVWEALVNPEPAELGKLEIAPLAAAMADFRKARSGSRIADAAEVLQANFVRLSEQANAVAAEEKDVARLMNKPAPDFALQTTDGKTVRLSDYRGKAVMLVFWGMGCRLCRTEAPHLTELHQKYLDRGFTVLAVEAFDNDAQDVKTYLTEQKLRHPVVVKGAEVSGSLYSIGGLPRAFWIDKEGRVTGRQVGFAARETLEKRIEELLKK